VTNSTAICNNNNNDDDDDDNDDEDDDNYNDDDVQAIIPVQTNVLPGLPSTTQEHSVHN
jgi:hypothetical protein